MKKALISLALATGLMTGTAAHAVLVMTQTLVFTPQLFGAGSNTETLFLDQFDTLSGRLQLQSVNVSWTSEFNNNITATSGSGNTRTMQTTASFTSSLSTGGNLFSFNNNIAGTSAPYVLSGQGSTASFAVSGSGTGSFSATNLNPFIGTGNISVTNSLSSIQGTITRFSGGNGNQSLTGGEALGTLTVQYLYLDPIPEPATWGMMILGFGMVGATMRRRRSAHAL